MTTSEIMVSELHDRVWSDGDYSAVARLIAPHYTIYSDPGDAWEGQSLDRGGYVERARFSRKAFPDVATTSPRQPRTPPAMKLTP